MSTPEQSVGIQAEWPAQRALFRALFDDAAVFPPGLAPLPLAVTDHVARQSGSYADLVGPLLLPAATIEEFLRIDRTRPVAVTVIGRPGTDLTLVRDAVARVQQDRVVTLTGVEIAWSPGWQESLRWGAPVSVEVPRSRELEEALADLQLTNIQKYPDGKHPVQAKFRTGSTRDLAIPTPTELATFIQSCIDHDLAFKLTGGLHHAISQTTADAEEQFGFLNVIAATCSALTFEVETSEMESILSQRDSAPIIDAIVRLDDAEASAVRTSFTAYGCCGVMDPIGELAALGLIKEKTG